MIITVSRQQPGEGEEGTATKKARPAVEYVAGVAAVGGPLKEAALKAAAAAATAPQALMHPLKNQPALLRAAFDPEQLRLIIKAGKRRN